MPRNLLQDMVRVKSGASTPAREIKREKERVVERIERVEREKIVEKEKPYREIKSDGRKPKYRLYFVALISVVFLLFALSFMFSGAKVTIIPKVKEIPLNENLTANKNGNASELPFDLVVIPGEESKTIQGGQEKDVAVKATGNILFFNSFSSAPQSLNIDTRLEGSNGKIYKTNKKIIIPGVKKDGNPGSVEVGIYANEAGEEYNSTPLDFKILGFKGTPKYSKIIAKSKGGKAGDITGGFIGRAPVVSDLDKTTAVSDLKVTLESKLLKKVTEQIPSGFILFKDAAVLDINDQDVTFSTDKNSNVVANIKGTLYGFLFDEKKLTKKIAGDVVDKYDESDVYIPNIRDLAFSLIDKENISFADAKTINFTLAGTPKIIWRVDESKFVTDVLDKKKDDFNKILLKYPNIDSAQLVLRPFWKGSFPDKSDSIQVIVNYPK